MISSRTGSPYPPPPTASPTWLQLVEAPSLWPASVKNGGVESAGDSGVLLVLRCRKISGCISGMQQFLGTRVRSDSGPSDHCQFGLRCELGGPNKGEAE